MDLPQPTPSYHHVNVRHSRQLVGDDNEGLRNHGNSLVGGDGASSSESLPNNALSERDESLTHPFLLQGGDQAAPGTGQGPGGPACDVPKKRYWFCARKGGARPDPSIHRPKRGTGFAHRGTEPSVFRIRAKRK